MAKCIRCGHELKLDCDLSHEEDIDKKYYVCPHCGITYDVTLPIDEDKQDYSYYNDSVKCDVSDENHGYEGKCTECGHYVIIMNNFMRSEVYGDVNEEDVDENGVLKDDAIVDCLFCPNCGADIMVVPPKPSEEEKYDYFKDN